MLLELGKQAKGVSSQ